MYRLFFLSFVWIFFGRTYGDSECKEGYSGTAVFENGAWIGCTACDSGKWASAGNGQTCVAISCSSKTGYLGTDGSCTCNTGYSGTVTYTNGALGGCYQNICEGVGYKIANGECICAEGYTVGGSSVSYDSQGKPTSCIPISCSLDGYSGTAGNNMHIHTHIYIYIYIYMIIIMIIILYMYRIMYVW